MQQRLCFLATRLTQHEVTQEVGVAERVVVLEVVLQQQLHDVIAAQLGTVLRHDVWQKTSRMMSHNLCFLPR